jgi:hypothetical protein
MNRGVSILSGRGGRGGMRRGARSIGSTGGRYVGGALGILLVATSLAGGCATARQTVGGWFGGTPTPTPVPAPARVARTYYVGVDRLAVHKEPSASSGVLGELSYRDRVTRYAVERGFARVKATTSGLTGWVDSAGLVRRRPAAKPAAAPAEAAPPAEEPGAAEEEAPAPEAPEAEETAAPEAPQPVPTDTPAPAGGPEPTPTPRAIAPSIFDAY